MRRPDVTIHDRARGFRHREARPPGARRGTLALLILGGAALLAGAWMVASGWGAAVAPPASAAAASPGDVVRTSGRTRRDHGGANGAAGSESTSTTGERDARHQAPSDAERAAVRQTAVALQAGRYNAFFDDRAVLEALASDEGSVAALLAELLDTAELEALPADVRFMQDEPRSVLDRIAMIDTLEALVPMDEAAAGALAEIATTPIDPVLPAHAKRAVAGEKYDVFVVLARSDWDAATEAFAQLESEPLRDALRPALIGGLVDSGVPREEAVAAAEQL